MDVAVREALYAEARGEPRIDRLLDELMPSIRSQVTEAVSRGEVTLSELWDLT